MSAGTDGWTSRRVTPFLDYSQISDDEVMATMSANGEAFVVFADRRADKVLVRTAEWAASGGPDADAVDLRRGVGACGGA